MLRKARAGKQYFNVSPVEPRLLPNIIVSWRGRFLIRCRKKRKWSCLFEASYIWKYKLELNFRDYYWCQRHWILKWTAKIFCFGNNSLLFFFFIITAPLGWGEGGGVWISRILLIPVICITYQFERSRILFIISSSILHPYNFLTQIFRIPITPNRASLFFVFHRHIWTTHCPS